MSGIYIHWPYCLSKCYYCDFYSVKCQTHNNLTPLYINVFLEILNTFYQGEKITSIYFGGGTPSLAPIGFFECVLNFIFGNFQMDNNLEITLEANPKTITLDKAKILKQIGINRLSLGIQSILDHDLKILGRIHTSFEALCCVCDMASIFNNISIDIIYNRPGQTLKNWQLELNQILKLPIQHISLYELIVEKNTYMYYLIKSGILKPPLTTSNFFYKTINIMKNNGWEMYEVSNFTKNRNYSKHNLSYWAYDNYYGIGASAHSRVIKNGQKYAIEQIADINKWKQWARYPKFPVSEQLTKTSNKNEQDNSALVKMDLLSQEEQDIERLLMGLRTKFGVKINELSKDFIAKYRITEKIKILQRNNYTYGNKNSKSISFCSNNNNMSCLSYNNFYNANGHSKAGNSKCAYYFNSTMPNVEVRTHLYNFIDTSLVYCSHLSTNFFRPIINLNKNVYIFNNTQFNQFTKKPIYQQDATYSNFFQIVSNRYFNILEIKCLYCEKEINNIKKNDKHVKNVNKCNNYEYRYINKSIGKLINNISNYDNDYNNTDYDDKIVLTVDGIIRLNLILKYLIQN